MSQFYDQASLVMVPSGYRSGKIYSQKPLSTSGELSFSRASTATRVNASGLIESVASGVPRLDYSGGASCPRLLLEPQRTAIVFPSEDFSVWQNVSCTVVSNTAISPDGYQNADTLTFTADAGSQRYSNQGSATVGTHTFSVYAKSSTAKKFRIKIAVDTGSGIVDDYSANFTTTTSWQRFTHTQTVSGSILHFSIANESGAVAGSADFWGAMAELGTYATSYIPTLSSAVTRVEEICNKTSITSLIGQTEGTLYAEFYWDGNPVENWIASVQTSASNFVAMFLLDDGRPYFYILNSGSVQMAYIGTALSVGYHKMAFGYAANNSVAYVDGVLKNTDTNCTIPATSEFRTGSVQSSHNQTAKINQALLFKTRLSNADLATLTTL